MDINISGLSVAFGDKKVLSGFDREFLSGRSYCITGISGRGKTTLARRILGLVKPCRGTIEISGGEIISPVFQEDRLCPELSAFMNVAIAAPNVGRDAVETMLGDLCLDPEDWHRPVSGLSGGQKRRVAIARALCREGDRVIMDEPFRGLDPKTKDAAMRIIKKRVAGRLFIFVTHERADGEFFKAERINIEPVEG